jgi:CheY-like chemotaxis protein
MSTTSILLVEDDAAVLSVLRSALVNAGYRVVPATDGAEAEATLTREEFALVITDLIMPGKDGIEMIKELRKTHPRLPILAISGGGRMPRDGYLKVAHLLGAQAVLGKPFSNEQLLTVVSGLLSANKA